MFVYRRKQLYMDGANADSTMLLQSNIFTLDQHIEIPFCQLTKQCWFCTKCSLAISDTSLHPSTCLPKEFTLIQLPKENNLKLSLLKYE